MQVCFEKIPEKSFKMFQCSKILKNAACGFFHDKLKLRNISLECLNRNKWVPSANIHKIQPKDSQWSPTQVNDQETRQEKDKGIVSQHHNKQYLQNDLSQSHIDKVRLKEDPDIFGGYEEPETLNESDLREEQHATEQVPGFMKLSTKQYADIIKEYIRKRQIKEAIDVLEVKMLKEDRVKPENYIYNLLLGACGRIGYTKKAFMLYNDMKKRGLKVTGGTYTALFNACANSPWALTDGLTRARHLYDIMIEKGYQPNDTNYNAMIKAFGRCGDLPMAFSLVDEMSKKGFTIKDDTINFLLQACISEKEAGFRHCLLVWRKVVEKNIQPSLYTFNLMLRCVRDCGLGDLEVTQDVIKKLVDKNNIKNNSRLTNKSSEIPHLNDDTSFDENNEQLINESEIQLPTDDISCDQFGELEKSISTQSLTRSTLSNKSTIGTDQSQALCRPNLLSKTPNLGNILSLSEVTKPEHRLLLVGGASGFLETMKQYKCTPDIKTFTQMLDAIPSTNAAEKELIIAMKKLNVKPDIDFYNMLIKKRSMRFDYEGAKEVLVSMQQQKYRPNLVTYGVLALGCKTRDEALELLDEMKRQRYRLNIEILGTMLRQACYHENFAYVFDIMELCLSENIPVNKKFLGHLEKLKERCKDEMSRKELSKAAVKTFGIFKARHKIWLEQVQKDESEEAHPWQQYRQNAQEKVQYVEKDGARFKPRHTSLFKVKTSTKHRIN